MFNQIFKCPRAIERHTAAPFLEQRESYLKHYAAQGASPCSLRHVSPFLLAIIDCLDLQPTGEISQSEIEAAADRWISRPNQVCRRKDSSAARTSFITFAKHWLGYLNRLQTDQIRPCPEASLLSQYIDHLEHERGFSPVTIQLSRQRITEFLGRVCYPDRSLRDLTVIDIDQAIAQKTRQDGCSRVSVQSYVYTLRSFFRYAESRGQCASGLAESLVSPHIFQGESLPAGPSWKDVQRLLSESEGDSRAEIRARAALLLFAVYGLRVGEVRKLRLQDLDWERELLIINRSKQQLRTQTYPLQQIVGDAVLRYLREVRPNCQHREVFVSLKAPIKPLSKTAFWQIVNHRLRPLNLSLKHQGPHALRHACASHLLAEGLSLKEIGDHLGHRTSRATAHYAKVDLVGLRQVADFNLGDLV